MSRKSVLLGLAIVLLLGSSVTGVLFAMLRHERGFYRRLATVPGPARKRDSDKFQEKFVAMMQSIAVDPDPDWNEEFTERQINSYFAEDFVKSGMSAEMLPEGISEPRVAFEPGRIRIGFRYGKPPWGTILSIDLRVWLVGTEPNVVAIEIQGLHAGGLPLTAQSLLERVFGVAKRNNIQVTWYHYNGNPVALLNFAAGQPRPRFKLERLELQDGLLIIGGKASEPLRAMLTMSPARLPAE